MSQLGASSGVGHVGQLPHNSHAASSLGDIVTQVIDTAKGEYVTLREVLESFGDASFAPILLLPALAVATPLSGIPLFSSVMGIIICLVSTQMLLRRRHLWLPDWTLRREVKGKVVRDAFGALKPITSWVDRRTGKRFRIIVRRPLVFVPQLICAVSGACMPLLEFVPFSSSIMGIGVALLALGMLARDGLVILIGLTPYSVVGWLIYTNVT